MDARERKGRCLEVCTYDNHSQQIWLPAGEWVRRGPAVQGRMYKGVEEWHGQWVGLVSDQRLDTLNAELLLLQNNTQARVPAEHNSSLDGGATVRLQCCSVPQSHALRGSHLCGSAPADQ